MTRRSSASSRAGSTAISSQHAGDLISGIRNPQTSDCDRILKAHGLRGVVTERDDGAALLMCDQFRLFRQAIDKVGLNPTRQSFIDGGVSRMGTFAAGAAGSAP